MFSRNYSHRVLTYAARLLLLVVACLMIYSPNLHAIQTAAAATENSVTLTWTAPGDDGSQGTAELYDIRYSTGPITQLNWTQATVVSEVPSPQPAGSTESFTVIDLQPGTTYYFAIKTADEVPNWSALSNVISVSTLADEIPPAPINDLLAVSGDSLGEVDLGWTATGDDDLSGSATAYEIRYSLSMISAENWESASLCPSPPAPLPCGQQQTHTLCELTPGEMYYVAVKAIDDAANASPVSNVDSGIAYYSLILDTDDDQQNLPNEYALAQNYPNPFNPATEICFSLATDSYVNLDIFNTAGQRVATLVDGQLPAGNHVTRWDGRSSSGQSVATGVYFYRIQAEDFIDSKKMVLLK